MTATGLVCGPCGTELPPNAKSYNESAVPSYRVRWTDSPPHPPAGEWRYGRPAAKALPIIDP